MRLRALYEDINLTPMSCNCDKAKNIPNCFTTLVVGDVVDASINYYVYFKTPDGRIDRYTSVDVVYTDIIGVENIQVRCGVMYEVWIAKQTAVNANERTSFIPSGQTEFTECINVVFDFCDDSFSSQTITLSA